MRRLIVLACLLLAGCTSTDSGTPTVAERPSATTTATTSSNSPTPSAKSRPRNIDLAAVDICAVVGALPRATFGLDTDRPPVGGNSGLFPGSKDCFNNGTQANLGLTLIAVVGQSAAQYVDGVNAKVAESDVNGFPLYVLTPDAPDSCFGVLDVDDGQFVFINYGLASPGSQPVTPQATLCERVPQIAQAALGVL